jgi:hypothetical protein
MVQNVSGAAWFAEFVQVPQTVVMEEATRQVLCQYSVRSKLLPVVIAIVVAIGRAAGQD